MLLKEAKLFAIQKQHLYRSRMIKRAELSPWQKADAARLKTLYLQWKADERAKGNQVNQESVGAALGMSQSAFSQCCRGVMALNLDILTKISTYFGWQPEDVSPTLANEILKIASIASRSDSSEYAPVRMLDAKASAGKGDLVFSEDTKKMLMFRRDYLTKNNAKAENVLGFEVDGDSMIDMHIIDGSVVLANQAKKEAISKRVYVVWIEGKLCVKQLVKVDGLWYARSRNSEKAFDYPDIQINVDDRVVGHAFWCGFGL